MALLWSWDYATEMSQGSHRCSAPSTLSVNVGCPSEKVQPGGTGSASAPSGKVQPGGTGSASAPVRRCSPRGTGSASAPSEKVQPGGTGSPGRTGSAWAGDKCSALPHLSSHYG